MYVYAYYLPIHLASVGLSMRPYQRERLHHVQLF